MFSNRRLIFVILCVCVFIPLYVVQNQSDYANVSMVAIARYDQPKLSKFICLSLRTFLLWAEDYDSKLILIEDDYIKAFNREGQLCQNLGNSILFGFLDRDSGHNFAEFVVEISSKIHGHSLWHYHILSKDHIEVGNKYINMQIVKVVAEDNFWIISAINGHPVRAILPPKIFEYSDKQSKIYLPDDVEFYQWQLSRSRLLDCNKTSAEAVKNIRINQNLPLTPVISEFQFETLPFVRDILYESRKDAFMLGGTLLGWYRDCDIVADTTDLDLALRSTSYDRDFEEKFVNQSGFEIYWILGRENDSLELSLYKHGVKMDLFLLYPLNETNTYVPGMVVPERKGLRYVFPRLTQLCTAILRSQLFFVPCNVVEFLTAEYGPTWFLPHFTTDYVWDQSARNIEVGRNWSDSEWPTVCRRFDNQPELVDNNCQMYKFGGTEVEDNETVTNPLTYDFFKAEPDGSPTYQQ